MHGGPLARAPRVGLRVSSELDLELTESEAKERELCGYRKTDSWTRAWDKHAAAHPEVLASWVKSNGYWPWAHPNRLTPPDVW